nr:sterol 3-beta-glucosyltransferase ugt80a2 [Quercus suber]
MAPTQAPEEGQLPEVPQSMVQQAEAAAAAAHHGSNATERRHMGHDVAPAQGIQSTNTDLDADGVPPPAYGEHYGQVANEKNGLGTQAQVADDGRVNIRIRQRDRRLSEIFVPSLQQLQSSAEHEHALPPPYIPPSLGGSDKVSPPPPMNVVVQVVGSRGDVQPFIALGKVLKDTYGHRVRLATHPNFQEFVTENGLEFFSIGGDPSALMAFMVKNPGLMPGFDTLRSGDVGKRRKEVGEYIKGCWRSCYEAGDGLGAQATDASIQDWTAEDSVANRPFVADVIIANPPSFAHVHCAEKMGIPLHIMFTMPYSPTQAFPHPLANIQSSNADASLTNYMSYALIDMLTWQGLGDVINRFRERSLGLDPISLVWAPGMLSRLRIPHTYCWSPALIPKPKDWAQHINISGFYFLNLATNYTPAPELQAFLDAGPPPVYIGFGSIVLDDPDAMTSLIFEAAQKTGQRVLLSKGWGGMGADEMGVPDGVFMLGNVPHDWLFKHVSCVVHHGGAGTTAAGITAGRPTVVVPFFGDQPFWGAMVARAGAGPEPIHHKQLTSDNLAEAITTCLKPESQERAQELADKIAHERGSDKGAQCFHQTLDVDSLRCTVAPSRTAVWRIKRTQVRLSAFVACTLANAGLLDFNDIKLFRPKEYETDEGPWDPISGGATALVGTMSTMMLGVADFPIETLKALKIHPDATKKKAKVDGERPNLHNRSSSASSSTSMQTFVTGRNSPRASSSGGAGRSSLDAADSSALSTPIISRRGSVSTLATTATAPPPAFNVQESISRIKTPPTPSMLSPRGSQSMSSSMADALRGQLGEVQKSRSRSGSRSKGAGISSGGDLNSKMDQAMGTAKGVQKIVGAGLSSPMDFTMGLTKGFHNAPKLFGDDTVRKAENVTDFKSGLKAATREFGFGMYDGITGLVTQPMRGAQKEGAAGFLKGLGKGMAGIALKPGAAIFGIPGYTMKGVYKELQKMNGSSVQNYIIAARTAQGYDEWIRASAEEKQDVISRWQVLQKDIKKKKNPDEMVRDILEEQMKKKQDALARWKTGMETRSRSNSRSSFRGDRPSVILDGPSPGPVGSSANRPHSHTFSASDTTGLGHEVALNSDARAETRAPTVPIIELDDHELHEAIKRSVEETSSGDIDEDAEVERAIQASLASFQESRAARHGGPAAEHDAEEAQMQAALQASQQDHHSRVSHDEELERVLAQSLREQRSQRGGDHLWNPPDAASSRISMPGDDHDADVAPPPEYAVEDSNLHLAGTRREEHERAAELAQKRAAAPTGTGTGTGTGGDDKNTQALSEEQIVLDYIKKQSLLEAEWRAAAAATPGKGKAPDVAQAPGDEDEHDEELQRALQESLKSSGGEGQGASGS